MKFHVPGEDEAKKWTVQRLRNVKRFLSSDRTIKDFTGKPYSPEDYAEDNRKQLERHHLESGDPEEKPRNTARKLFTDKTAKEEKTRAKFIKKPVTEKVWHQQHAELVEKHRRDEERIQRRFGVDADNYDSSTIKNRFKGAIKKPFRLRTTASVGRYTAEDYERDKKELEKKHGIVEEHKKPGLKTRTVEKLRKRFSPKPYLEKETPIYNEEDYERDSKKSYEPIKRHAEKLKKRHENAYSAEKIAIEHRELKRQENEKEKQRLKKRKLFSTGVPKYQPGRTHEEITRESIKRVNKKTYLKKETPIYNEGDSERDSNKSYEPTKRHTEEHENTHSAEKIAIKHRELKRQEKEKEKKRLKKRKLFSTEVPKYQPGRTHEEITQKSTDEWLKRPQRKYEEQKRQWEEQQKKEGTYVETYQPKPQPTRIPDKSELPQVSFVPLESVKYIGRDTTYKKLRRWGPKGARYAVKAGAFTFFYLRDKMFAHLDDNPDDVGAKGFREFINRKNAYKQIFYDNFKNANQHWDLPKEEYILKKWDEFAGKEFRLRGQVHTVGEIFNKQLGGHREFDFEKVFTVRGRTFHFHRHFKIGINKFTVAQGLKYGAKFGYYTIGSVKNTILDSLGGDGVSDTMVGSIAHFDFKVRMARVHYANAKGAYRLGKQGVQLGRQGVHEAVRTGKMLYNQVGVPLVRGTYAAGRALVTDPVGSVKYAGRQARTLLRYSGRSLKALGTFLKSLPRKAFFSVGKLAAAVKVLVAKVIGALVAKPLFWVLIAVIILVLLLVICMMFAAMVSSFFMADEDTVVNYRELIAAHDEEFRETVNDYLDADYDHIYIHYMNENGINTNWQHILALVTVVRQQDIDYSEEEQRLVKEIYDKLNYIQTYESTHTHDHDDGTSTTHTVLDVYVYTLPVEFILNQYLTEQWEYDWYNRLINVDINEQYGLAFAA